MPAAVYPAWRRTSPRRARAETLADAARRLNYAVNGVRSTLMRAAREVESAPAGSVFDAPFFAAVDPQLVTPDFMAAVRAARGPVSGFYLLGALDLQQSASGAIERTPPDQRIYLDVLGRTLGISAAVTLICLLAGFPVAALLTQVQGRAADWLMVLVMLPFWTSLLVRTAAWVVLLQREGLINSALMRLGLLAEPLELIYNRTGVLIAMTPRAAALHDPAAVQRAEGDPAANTLRAAASLGAPPHVRFFRVYLPLAAPGIAAGALMVFILALGYYITPALVGGGGDQMLSYFVAKYTMETGNWGLAAALGLVLLVDDAGAVCAGAPPVGRPHRRDRVK